MTNDLLRQRRNLLITSIGLLLFDFAHVSVAKISILGTELLVGNTIVLEAFAWVLWGYFLLRYYQYLKSEKDGGVTEHAGKHFKFLATQHVMRATGRDSLHGEVLVSRNGFRWLYSVAEMQLGEREVVGNGALPSMRAWWWRLRAYLHIALHTPRVTDHVLPFALAIATPIVIVGRAI
jgi:hypothetical protein